MEVYRDRVKSSLFGCVKTPRLRHRKWVSISQYRPTYDVLTPGVFTLAKKATFHPIAV